jgi:hypothetical protein
VANNESPLQRYIRLNRETRNADWSQDGYTSTPNRIRVYKADVGDEYPWHVDGVDSTTGFYTETVLRYGSHATAVTFGVRELVVALGY